MLPHLLCQLTTFFQQNFFQNTVSQPNTKQNTASQPKSNPSSVSQAISAKCRFFVMFTQVTVSSALYNYYLFSAGQQSCSVQCRLIIMLGSVQVKQITWSGAGQPSARSSAVKPAIGPGVGGYWGRLLPGKSTGIQTPTKIQIQQLTPHQSRFQWRLYNYV